MLFRCAPQKNIIILNQTDPLFTNALNSVNGSSNLKNLYNSVYWKQRT